MAWVVDTCVLLDVLDAVPVFGLRSAKCLENKLPRGLVVCPVTYVELAPAFLGDYRRADEFFRRLGADFHTGWTGLDTRAAFDAWAAWIDKRRLQGAGRRPVADILIGAFAIRFEGLITRNPKDFKAVFPKLTIIAP